MVSFATRARVRLRAKARPEQARAAETRALTEGWKALPKEKGDVDTDGKVEGAPLDAVHDALGTFYKNDEAHAFDAWYTKKGASALIVVYFEARGTGDPIWLAIERARKVITDPARLPRGAFLAMKHATE